MFTGIHASRALNYYLLVNTFFLIQPIFLLGSNKCKPQRTTRTQASPPSTQTKHCRFVGDGDTLRGGERVTYEARRRCHVGWRGAEDAARVDGGT